MRYRRFDRLDIRFDLHLRCVRYPVTQRHAAPRGDFGYGGAKRQYLELIAPELRDHLLLFFDLLLLKLAFGFRGNLTAGVEYPAAIQCGQNQNETGVGENAA